MLLCWKKLLGLIGLIPLLLLIACTEYDHETPDTAANLAGFEHHFGFEAPTDVQNLYYFADELGADVKYQLGFEASPETVARVVSELNLVPSEKIESTQYLDCEFPWWRKDDIQKATYCWKKTNEGQDYWYLLWYDEDTRRVYYFEYSL